MRRRPNRYEACALYQGAKDEAFTSPGEEYAVAFYYLSRIDWLDLGEAKVIAQKASDRVIEVRALDKPKDDEAFFADIRERLANPRKGIKKQLDEL